MLLLPTQSLLLLESNGISHANDLLYEHIIPIIDAEGSPLILRVGTVVVIRPTRHSRYTKVQVC